MPITYLSIFSALCLLIVVYPYIIYPLVLRLLKHRESPISTELTPSCGEKYALLFCAFNEIRALPEKVSNLAALKARYPDLEIWAYDDNSSDGTFEYLVENANFVNVIRSSGRTGKAHGMKLLATKTTREFLIFTDANVLLKEDVVEQLAACYRDSEVGGVCGTLLYLGEGESTTSQVGGAYWRLEEKIKSLESSSGSVIGADGSIFSIRHSLYPDFPDSVLDDFTVSMEVVFAGQRLIKCNRVVAYERLVSNRKDEFQRKVRIATRAFHTHLYLSKRRRQLRLIDRFKYFSHKTLRWFGGLFLALMVSSILVSIALAHVFAAIFIATAAAATFIASISMHIPILSSISEIALAMIATLIGVVRAAKGQTMTTWTPATSR